MRALARQTFVMVMKLMLNKTFLSHCLLEIVTVTTIFICCIISSWQTNSKTSLDLSSFTKTGTKRENTYFQNIVTMYACKLSHTDSWVWFLSSCLFKIWSNVFVSRGSSVSRGTPGFFHSCPAEGAYNEPTNFIQCIS